MNSSFQKVVAFMKGPTRELTHKQTVTRMYKKSLKLCLNWAIDRDLWHSEATKIRKQFDDAKHLSPTDGLTVRLIREANEKMEFYSHPDGYVIPWMPGGSKFMRNPPLPLEAIYDGEEGDDQELSPVTAVNVDMSPLPAKKHVLVDFGTKEY